MPDQQKEIALVRKKTFVMVIWGLLTLVAGASWFPGLAAAQVSPVPPGLVLPIGTTIRVWESGATDYSTPNSVNLVLAYKGGNFSIDDA